MPEHQLSSEDKSNETMGKQSMTFLLETLGLFRRDKVSKKSQGREPSPLAKERQFK
jgi:hypothetical protein